MTFKHFFVVSCIVHAFIIVGITFLPSKGEQKKKEFWASLIAPEELKEPQQQPSLPDFEIGVQGVRDEPMGEDGYQLMSNVTVPLYFATKQRYGVREARAAREGAAGDLQAVRQELAMRVRDDVAQIERAEKLIALRNGAIVPQVQLALDSARSGYAVGRVDFLTLLNSLFTLQENELELKMEIAEHEKARARLEEIIGEEP